MRPIDISWTLATVGELEGGKSCHLCGHWADFDNEIHFQQWITDCKFEVICQHCAAKLGWVDA